MLRRTAYRWAAQQASSQAVRRPIRDWQDDLGQSAPLRLRMDIEPLDSRRFIRGLLRYNPDVGTAQADVVEGLVAEGHKFVVSLAGPPTGNPCPEKCSKTGTLNPAHCKVTHL